MKKKTALLLAYLFFWTSLPALPVHAVTVIKDLIVKESPWVDVRAFMDGTGGRPTLAAWEADQANGEFPTVDVLPAIRAAVDYALQNKIMTVFMPDGIFKITGPIHTTYGEPGFRTITLCGSGQVIYGDAGHGFAGTLIDASSFSNAPAIVVQGGRDVEIKDLAIKGASFRYGLFTYGPAINTQTVSWDNISTATNWVTNVTANGLSRYAPYAAIAIDPYAGVRPATSYPDVTYPSWLGIGQTQYGKRFSSRTRITNVTIDGFYVGVAVQPCDADGNGDFTTMKNLSVFNTSYAVSVGNTQSRNVTLEDSTFQYVHSIIANNINGKQAGVIDGPITNCSASQIFQMVSLSSQSYAGAINFINFYSEDTVRIGNLGTTGSTTHTISFTNCSIFYLGWANGLVTGHIYNVPAFASSGPINIDSSSIEFNHPFGMLTDRATNKAPVTVRQSQIYSFGYETLTDNASKIAYNYFPGGVANLSPNKWLEGSMWVPAMSGMYPISRTTSIFTDEIAGREQIHSYAKRFSYTTGPKKLIQDTRELGEYISVTSPAFNASTLAYTFTHSAEAQALNKSRIEAGSVLYDDSPSKAIFVVDNVTYNAPNWNVSATMVTNYWTNSSAAKIPIVTPETASPLLYLYQTSNKKTAYEWRGNTVSGSDNVTNLTIANGGGTVSDDFKVGDYLYNTGGNFWDDRLPANAKVLAVGSGWMQMDKNATATDNGVPIELHR